jgi:hypothetical protein
MKVNLVVLSQGNATGQVLPISLSQFLIGRDKQCNLRPVSPLISKRHCAILIKDNQVFVRDLDSTNGTLVNDNLITGEVEVANGDVLQVGPLHFRIVLEHTTPVNAPTPLPGKTLGVLENVAPAAESDLAPPAESQLAPPAESAVAAREEPATPAPDKSAPAAEEPPAPAKDKNIATAEKPAKPQPSKSHGSLDSDDSIAALLLEDDGTTSSIGQEVGENGVPEGTTMMDIPMPLPDSQAKAEEEKKKKENKAVSQTANTSSAAADLLALYQRRPKKK